MALFGHYDTKSQLASTPNSSVYRARSTSEPGDNYVIKVFSSGGLHEAGESDTHAPDDAVSARLLELFSLQQKAAANCPHIAPILGTGKDFRGNAWYATRFYPRSIQKVIAGRVALNKEAFFHVFTAVAAGLQALKKTCGRSHGNLKPANVLISGGESIVDSEVVVADAALENGGDTAKLEIADLRTIGEIIYQLVRRRELESRDDLFLPLLSTKEWTSVFGRQTKQWLAICNRLLDPNLSLSTYSLDQLERDLAGLKPKKAPVLPIAAVSAAALVLALGLGWFFWQKSNKKSLLITSDPVGATIAIDIEGFQPQSTPADGKPLEVEVPEGQSDFIIKAVYPGLSEQVTNIVVQEAGSHDVAFRFPYGSVAITSEPANAVVKIDSNEVGRTPCVVNYLKPASVTFQVDLQGHESTNATVVVNLGGKTPLHATLAKISEADATIEFESDVGDTIFQVNNEDVDTPARYAKKALPPGAYTFTATIKEWNITKTTNFTVKAGDSKKAKFAFGLARLELTSSPPGAKVQEGANELGTTPFEKRFPPGKRTFTLDLPGHDATNIVINFTENQVLQTNITLETAYGFLVLSSDPPGAEILSSGKVIGRANGNPIPVLPVPASHTLIARYPGLSDKTETLEVQKRKQKASKFQFDYGTVIFETVPTNAVVKVAGTNFIASRPLPLRNLEFEISASGYDTITTNITIAKGAQKVGVSLPVPLFPVTLQSDPDGAEIFDGPRKLGPVSSVKQLRGGTYSLIAKYNDLDPVTNSVTVTRNGADRSMFKFQYAAITVSSTPSGAEVLKEKSRLGVTPMTFLVKPGSVSYDLVWREQTQRVSTNAVAGQTHTLGYSFTPSVQAPIKSTVGIELVKVTEDLYVSRFEVTQGQYQSMLNTNPSPQKAGGTNMPVTGVNWTNALGFCQLLTEADKAVLADLGLSGFAYTIPTEDDWNKYSSHEPATWEEAVFRKNDPLPVTSERKSANLLGLYDVYGNVAEWLVRADGQPAYIGGAYSNQTTNSIKMISDARIAEAGARNIGFRCVLKRQ
jgi:hypothetical protein